MPPSRTLRAVGAYVYAGGFTVGVRRAGFTVRDHLEDRPAYGKEVIELNLPDVMVHEGHDAWPTDLGEVDLLYGNPPCAAWSANNCKSHQADSWRSDPRVDCTRRHFSLLEVHRPKVWVWESVCQTPAKGRELVEELTSRAVELGYSVTQLYHDAARLGTPQTRRRWFMVAHRVELSFPESSLLPEITALEALSRVRPVGPPAYDSGKNQRFVPRLPEVPPGARLRTWQEENMVPEGGWKVKENGHLAGRVGFGHVRLRPDRPATATVGYSMIHPVEHRFLSVNEVATLAGFPDGYQFPGSATGAKQLDYIARGVCPPVAEWLARRVREALRHEVPVAVPSVTTVDLTGGVASRASTKSRAKMEAVGDDDDDDQGNDDVGEDQGLEDDQGPTREGRERLMTMETRNKLKGSLGKPGSKPQDLDRRYDTTQLRESGHGTKVHRDYAAHYFRWGWASRFVDPTTKVLDVGCGQDLPLVKILTASLSSVPAAYVGVDLNQLTRTTKISWVKDVRGEFDFPGGGWRDIKKTHGTFDLVTCFEVIEHMHQEDGRRLLAGVRECLADDGTFLLSTPVYNGKKMAANHLREYTVAELQEMIEAAGFSVVRRHGTFASWNDVRRVCTDAERRLLDEVGSFYGGDVLACFLAPKYPDHSRNNAWVLRRSPTARLSLTERTRRKSDA